MLKTRDNHVINLVLDKEVNLHIQEDEGYKIVDFKGGQVNSNQQTVVRLVDFISVMVSNKREDRYSFGTIIFPYQHIIEFLEIHKKFMFTNQIIKVFILNSRFRLSIKYLTDEKIKFEMDFFSFAIQSNAYDIAFFLR